MSQVNTELSYSSTAQISLNDSAVRTLFGIASGTISLNDGHGKSSNISATGGTIYTSGGYKYHLFTSSGAFTVSSAPSGKTVSALIVAGGAGGGGRRGQDA